VGVGVTVWRVIAHPYEADVTLVVGAWNLLNLIMAGCALGVVSERTDPRHSHRVNVQRRAEFLFGDQVVPATIEDVSYGGAKIRFGSAKRLQGLASGAIATIRFQPHGQEEMKELPLRVRTITNEDGVFLGTQFMPGTAEHHRLIADLIFANSDQWTQFQRSRRRNPGILRGTFWFLGTAFWQTGRGLVYLVRAMRPRHAEAGATASSGH
jgi:cellulose synthase (UDP-forming)